MAHLVTTPLRRSLKRIRQLLRRSAQRTSLGELFANQTLLIQRSADLLRRTAQKSIGRELLADRTPSIQC